MEIPWTEIPVETLDKLLEEMVTRDGTDYGASEKSTEQKVSDARQRLADGNALLYWDADFESASLLSKEEVALLKRQLAN